MGGNKQNGTGPMLLVDMILEKRGPKTKNINAKEKYSSTIAAGQQVKSM